MNKFLSLVLFQVLLYKVLHKVLFAPTIEPISIPSSDQSIFVLRSSLTVHWNIMNPLSLLKQQQAHLRWGCLVTEWRDNNTDTVRAWTYFSLEIHYKVTKVAPVLFFEGSHANNYFWIHFEKQSCSLDTVQYTGYYYLYRYLLLFSMETERCCIMFA